MTAPNYYAPDGYRYGVMFGDGSVAHYWNGRTQRERAEEFLVDVSARWPGDAPRYALVWHRPGQPWTRVDVACKCSTGCPNDLSEAEVAYGLGLCGLCVGEGCTSP